MLKMSREYGAFTPVGGNWLITFADLLTSLLAFFLLCLAMTSEPIKNFGELITPKDKTEARRQELAELVQSTRTVLEAKIGTDIAPEIELPTDLSVTPSSRGVEIALGEESFLSGDDTLSPGALLLIGKLAPMIREKHLSVEIEGHTDNIPIHSQVFASNWELSAARAISVANALLINGVEGKLLSAVGYAETRPIADNQTESGRAKNRRVELFLVRPK